MPICRDLAIFVGQQTDDFTPAHARGVINGLKCTISMLHYSIVVHNIMHLFEEHFISLQIKDACTNSNTILTHVYIHPEQIEQNIIISTF